MMMKQDCRNSLYLGANKTSMTKSTESLSFLILVVQLVVLIGCVDNKNDYFTTADLQDGLPEPLKSIGKDVPFEEFSYTPLNTGTDTLQVYIGKFKFQTKMGYWIGISSKGTPGRFSAISLDKIDTLDYRTKDVDIAWNDERNKVSLRINEIDSLNFEYAWLNNSELSQEMVLKFIERPLRKNSQLPMMTLESFTGEPISSTDFKDQFVVINWWATWCAPCIAEIPGLNEMVDKYSANENVRFIAITDDPRNRIKSFMERSDFKYEITFANKEVQNVFGNSYPVNMIVDPKGKITFIEKGAGPYTPQEIESSLKKQLEVYEIAKTR